MGNFSNMFILIFNQNDKIKAWVDWFWMKMIDFDFLLYYNDNVMRMNEQEDVGNNNSVTSLYYFGLKV
ncbi:hypothetical protein ACIQZG_00950 [Lysinibacillus sp. NPDC096418]|uniref:hypothetical protein n=1 Tax=Lysinibacillus sp. NPDC096418 TaxID=3364138 RepID=UPI003816B91A